MFSVNCGDLPFRWFSKGKLEDRQRRYGALVGQIIASQSSKQSLA